MTGVPNVVVLSTARTPVGRYGGALASIPAFELGALVVRASMQRSGVLPDDVDELVMGLIGQVGPDAYNARRIALASGMPTRSGAYNVNRLCGSGLQAILSAAAALQVGSNDLVVAGGNESMSRMPFFLEGARDGLRLGHQQLRDGTLAMLTDPWSGHLMGWTAENVAREFGVSRTDQDAWAALSQARANAAIARGAFEKQIVPVPVGDLLVKTDEHPRPDSSIDQLSTLRPSFDSGGTVTAGNSSGINDGAAAVVLEREEDARRLGHQPSLRLLTWAQSGCAPEVMGYAPAYAIPKALKRAGMTIGDMDVIELNEAFAAQVVAVMRATGISPDQANPNGGAIAFGHPVGATGAILLAKLDHDLRDRNLELGMVTMCIGGGQALAAIFERI